MKTVSGATLHAGFVFDVLTYYGERWMAEVTRPLFTMTSHLDREKPNELVPVELYNDVCAWIERHIGEASVRNAGRDIGQRVFEEVARAGGLSKPPSPHEVLHGMMRAAEVVVHDPLGRGFNTLEEGPTHMRIRLTATFNCILQEGLMTTLVSRAGGLLPRVQQEQCVRNGDRFCEYLVTWRPALSSLEPAA